MGSCGVTSLPPARWTGATSSRSTRTRGWTWREGGKGAGIWQAAGGRERAEGGPAAGGHTGASALSLLSCPFPHATPQPTGAHLPPIPDLTLCFVPAPNPLAPPSLAPPSTCRRAFTDLDRDQDGVLRVEEILAQLSAKLPDAEVALALEHALQEAGQAPDAEGIDFNDFLRMLKVRGLCVCP